jgi:asparagine synthetase B (glutamine-hydrolysing)
MWKNKEIAEFYKYGFDFDHQHKNKYDDWLKAFEKAVKKRVIDGCFIGLSSGYDSGSLTKEMVKQMVDFKAYTMFNNENELVINQRLQYITNYQVSKMSQELWQKYYDFLKGKINDKAMADIASMGVAYMFETAKDEGRKVCISGQGGDEIISDYALYPGQSTFKGRFPEKLYEWENFRGNMQMEYLNELEEIAEIYGIEVRYPFLDVDLVQEYLWLTADLKNKHYKSPLREYLIRNKVPFDEGVKRGFNPIPK